MQVARLLHGRARALGGAARSARRCGRCSSSGACPRTRSCALYLRLAPFGGNLEGVRAASLAYFGKEPRRLSRRRSRAAGRHAAVARDAPPGPRRRKPRAARATACSPARWRRRDLRATTRPRAMAERMPTARREFPMLAAAPCRRRGRAQQGAHRASPDPRCDRPGQPRAAGARPRQHAGRPLSAALIAVDHRTGEVIAHVGSPGYLDEARFGAVDMTSAVRSPGSTLKPFIYGLAFEAGLAHPETLIEDRPARFGLYVPEELRPRLARHRHDPHGAGAVAQHPRREGAGGGGPAKLFTAACSRPASSPCCPRAPSRRSPSRSAASASSSPTSPRSMRASRAAASRRAQYRRAATATQARSRPAQRLLSPVAAWYVGDILRHAPPPANAKPGQLAYKTGTSYGFRDAWAVGFDGRHTIAVWVGRPDGAATPGLSGAIGRGAAAVRRLRRIGERRVALAAPPSGASAPARASCRRRCVSFRGIRRSPAARRPLGAGRADRLPAGPRRDRDRGGLGRRDHHVKAEGGALPLTWLVDGVPIVGSPAPRCGAAEPEPGLHQDFSDRCQRTGGSRPRPRALTRRFSPWRVSAAARLRSGRVRHRMCPALSPCGTVRRGSRGTRACAASCACSTGKARRDRPCR